MHKINLSDSYSVMIEKPLCDYDRRTLNALYLPIVGVKAINLFYSFHDSIISNEHESHVYNFSILSRRLEFSQDILEVLLNKLEAVGLIETYCLNNFYVFYVKDVLTPSKFFKDEEFGFEVYIVMKGDRSIKRFVLEQGNPADNLNEEKNFKFNSIYDRTNISSVLSV